MKVASLLGVVLSLSGTLAADAASDGLFVAPGRMNRLGARAPKDCGVWHMDCSKAPAACNNACFYQNCVNSGKTVTYRDGGSDGGNDENRIQAGAKVSRGNTVCRTYPIVQKMWDRYPGGVPNDNQLETDEWPMAAMQQDDFKPGTIRNTLRCIEKGDNGSGGSQYKQFRRGEGDYYGKDGKYKADRKCLDPGKVMSKGDTFTVKFENVDANKSPYCKPSPDCANDGFEFHLTKLVDDGFLGSPYDYDTMNRYRVTNENADLRQYSVVVTRTGNDGQDFAVDVYDDPDHKNKKGSGKEKLDAGKSMTVSGLGAPLVVKSNGGLDKKVSFEYATKAQKTKYFAFDTDSKGQYTSKTAPYCMDKKSNNKVEWTCDFPGF